jgi:hypothetical protein
MDICNQIINGDIDKLYNITYDTFICEILLENINEINAINYEISRFIWEFTEEYRLKACYYLMSKKKYNEINACMFNHPEITVEQMFEIIFNATKIDCYHVITTLMNNTTIIPRDLDFLLQTICDKHLNKANNLKELINDYCKTNNNILNDINVKEIFKILFRYCTFTKGSIELLSKDCLYDFKYNPEFVNRDYIMSCYEFYKEYFPDYKEIFKLVLKYFAIHRLYNSRYDFIKMMLDDGIVIDKIKDRRDKPFEDSIALQLLKNHNII